MPDLSVAENITISTPPRRFGLIDSRAQRRRAEQLLAEIGCEDVNPLVARARSRAVAPADGGDRQGARPQSATADPRRGDVGADQRRRREGLQAAGAAEGAGRRDPLHLAPHARGRRARRPRLGVSQRPPYRNLRHGRALDRRDRATDDRPRHHGAISAKAAARVRTNRRCASATSIGRTSLSGITLDVGAGEIVGLGGLDGQGQKMLLLALFGVLKGVGGRIEVNGRAVKLRSPGRGQIARRSASRWRPRIARPRA